MKSMLIAAAAALMVAVTLATPDCYDFSVTTLEENYFELLPKMLFYGNVDWMTLKAGKNCGFYTYGDVFLKSYDTPVQGIYFVFQKTLGTTCTLNSTMHTFKNETWLYANSINADQNVCGYYIGVANSGTVDQVVQVIRSSAVFLKSILVGAVVALSLFA